MKKTEMLIPVNCEVLKEEKAKAIFGGYNVEGQMAVWEYMCWNNNYFATGLFARKYWPNSIPDDDMWDLQSTVIGRGGQSAWDQFMAGYNSWKK